MSLTDEYCNENSMDNKEKLLYYRTSLLLYEMLEDLENKGYLRTELRAHSGQRALFMNVLLNVRKITKAFNYFFDVYVDRAKPDSKQKLTRIIEVGEFSEEDAIYLLFSTMVFTFLQNIEDFRSALLHILKLPIFKLEKMKIGDNSTLNQLLKNLEMLKIKNANSLSKLIEGDLRNGLSHGLFWFEMKDKDCSELHLHYSKDSEFKVICGPIGISKLFEKTRKQSLYTNCLLNVIADWFEDT